MNLDEILQEVKEMKENLENKLQTPQIIGSFEKVSFEQFAKDFGNKDVDSSLETYENVIKLPVRSSVDSAGHDFILPEDITLKPGESVKIQTGIRAKIERGWVLNLVPRSGLGSKFRLQLNNTIGVIDGDYYNADNEGHILVTLMNDSKDKDNVLELKAGDRFIQGVFTPYGITNHDEPLGKRTGGHGSSGK